MTTSTWDAAGRLASVSTSDSSIAYGYDGLGRRASTTTTDSTGAQYASSTAFDGLTPLASNTTGDIHGQSTGDDQDVWVRDVLGNQLLESATALTSTTDGTDRWDLLDSLGSLIAQSPATGVGAGTVTQAMGWSAFGTAQPATTGWDETSGYTGQTTDISTGLVGFQSGSCAGVAFVEPRAVTDSSPPARLGG